MELIAPSWSIVANDQTITAQIAEFFAGLTVTDDTGDENDELTLTLADPDNRLILPPRGAVLDVAIGWDGRNTRMGRYIVDERTVNGVDEIEIRAQGAAVNANRKYGRMQSQASRTWPKGTTIATVVRSIAARQSLQPVISTGLAGIEIPHTGQDGESDMHFLTRLARPYDAVVRINGGKLLFLKRGEALAASGQALATITILPEDVEPGFNWQDGGRQEGGSVITRWRDRSTGVVQTVTAGSGDPISRPRHVHGSAASALQAANALANKRKRSQTKMDVTLVYGNPNIRAESRLTTVGFRSPLNTTWQVAKVTHNINSEGFTSNLSLEAIA